MPISKDLLTLVEYITETKKAHLISLKENIDTNTPAGKMMLGIIGSIYQFERECLLERQREGIRIAKEKNIYPLLKKLEKDEYVIGEWDDPKKKFQKVYSLTQKGIEEYESRKHLLKPKIEEALKVFKIIYKDLYK